MLAIEGLEGTGFSTDLIPGAVSLTPQASVDYNVYYTPSPGGADQATLIIKTNGGDLNVALTGSPVTLPAGYTVESFEGATYPPVGWELNIPNGWEASALNPRSGEMAVEAFWRNLATLTSPPLDLSASNHQVTFDYAAAFDEEELYTPENIFYLELSTDGGATWNRLWTAPTPISSPYTRITVSLGSPALSSCLLRWVYYIEREVSYDTICSTIYLDNIVLPPLLGTGQKPEPVTNPQPADGSTGQPANDLTLSWQGSLLADYYKLYVGTDAGNPVSILDGEFIPKNDPTAWQLEGLTYETTYYWKVIAANAAGESADNPTWSFTTGTDQSISEFPYIYGFEDGLMPPTGWQMYGENNCRWTNFRDAANSHIR
ncbi:MAG: fibronectin type III domain-containing protein [Tannerellaceae bacterium]|nr:fibronectin type III domain-containing protein [Tannerellaceae bacterium]MCD8264616.1 fibronectin type III domain-containing protein [Tannerellaceae bacterium]